MANAELGGDQPDLSAFTKYEIDQAENSFLKWLDWRKSHEIEPIMSEAILVSETYQFGGQIDCYCRIDGKLALIDNKTSKAIYSEHWLQVAGYGIILRECGYPVEETHILQIGRDETEGFHEEIRRNLSTETEIFLLCRQIYELQKKLKGGD
jgi:predicted RecB family nuclease